MTGWVGKQPFFPITQTHLLCPSISVAAVQHPPTHTQLGLLRTVPCRVAKARSSPGESLMHAYMGLPSMLYQDISYHLGSYPHQ